MEITRHFIDVDGRQVHYRRAGSGPPLLMVHQSPRSSAEYEPLMARWAAHFTCIAPDTPGFGQSTALAGDPDIVDFADAIVAFLDAAGLRQVAAYGFHSGGIILVSALRRHPQRFSALAIGGYGVWTPEESAIFGESYLPPFLPAPYGEHLTWLWNRVLEQSWFFPWFDVRPEARLRMAHADPVRVDAVVREMLDSGDAYRAGYGAVLRAPRDIPSPEAQSPPVLITAYDGDPLQAHIGRLGDLPSTWSAYPVASPAEHQEASLAFLQASPPPGVLGVAESHLCGFVRVGVPGFSGLVHWRGARDAGRVVLHAPGRSVELLAVDGTLAIDLPGHGLSDDYGGADIGGWARLVAAAVGELSLARAPVIVGEGLSALLALAVGREVGAAGVEAIEAHIPLAADAPAWLAHQPDLTPDRFGNYLTTAWSVVRAAHFFWPWFRADADHAIPFAPAQVEAGQLAVEHRSLIRARAAKALTGALLAADRAQLLAEAPPVSAWQTAPWARTHPGVWQPACERRQ